MICADDRMHVVRVRVAGTRRPPRSARPPTGPAYSSAAASRNGAKSIVTRVPPSASSRAIAAAIERAGSRRRRRTRAASSRGTPKRNGAGQPRRRAGARRRRARERIGRRRTPAPRARRARRIGRVGAKIDTQSSERQAGTTPAVLSSPRVGFRPTRLLNAAGTRPEPAVSVPSAERAPAPWPPRPPSPSSSRRRCSARRRRSSTRRTASACRPGRWRTDRGSSCRSRIAPASSSRCTTVADRARHVGKRRTAGRGRHAGDVDVVLDRERHAGERQRRIDARGARDGRARDRPARSRPGAAPRPRCARRSLDDAAGVGVR